VVRHCIKGRGTFLISGFEGSQAVPACPSSTGTFEKGWSFRKRKSMKPEEKELTDNKVIS
jgi:hypothetical protein